MKTPGNKPTHYKLNEMSSSADRDDSVDDSDYKGALKITRIKNRRYIRMPNFAKRSVNILKNWLNQHLDNPYPTHKEKDSLSHESGLSKRQIQNWFTNARKRIWQPMIREQQEVIEENSDGLKEETREKDLDIESTKLTEHKDNSDDLSSVQKEKLESIDQASYLTSIGHSNQSDNMPSQQQLNQCSRPELIQQNIDNNMHAYQNFQWQQNQQIQMSQIQNNQNQGNHNLVVPIVHRPQPLLNPYFSQLNFHYAPQQQLILSNNQYIPFNYLPKCYNKPTFVPMSGALQIKDSNIMQLDLSQYLSRLQSQQKI